MEERWRSVDEVAACLGVSRETVYRWIASKRMPAHRIGKFWKFKTSELDAWAGSDQTEGGLAPPSGSRQHTKRRTSTKRRQ